MALAAALASACSAPQSREILADPARESRAGVRLDVPFFPQTDYHCGPAALAGLFSYNGLDTTPEQVATQVYLPGRKGSLQAEMTAAIRRHELLAYPLYAGDGRELQRLLQAIDQGYPVLVLQNLGLERFPQWHYATLTGYDLANGHVILNSGTREDYPLPFATFERTWKRSDYWARLVSPTQKVPPLADLHSWNKAAFDLEATGHVVAALSAYRASLRRWPGNQTALLGSGNTAFARDDYLAAADAFYQFATGQGEQAATGWNNLAYAMSALGCPRAARSAASLALVLSPEQQAIQDTVRAMAVDVTEAADGQDLDLHCRQWRKRLLRASGSMPELQE